MATTDERLLWQTGDTWPVGDVRDFMATEGLTVVTHRGTSHHLAMADGVVTWARARRGQPAYVQFVPSAIGRISPCGFAAVGAHDEWWASSRVVLIARGFDLPDDDILDKLLAAGTPDMADHPDAICDAVYCQQVPVEDRSAHLRDLLNRISNSTSP